MDRVESVAGAIVHGRLVASRVNPHYAKREMNILLSWAKTPSMTPYWRPNEKRRPCGRRFHDVNACCYSSGTISNATMLMILISGLIAGPAVSL